MAWNEISRRKVFTNAVQMMPHAAFSVTSLGQQTERLLMGMEHQLQVIRNTWNKREHEYFSPSRIYCQILERAFTKAVISGRISMLS